MNEADLQSRIWRLEAESDIRKIVMRYFQICDDLGPDTPFDELAELFTPDAVWQGEGRYEDAFGRYEGRTAIVEMIRSYCLPSPHFAMTAHFVSSERLCISEGSATGEWMMLQTSDYTDGTADLRSAALKMFFEIEDGRWRIATFGTRNLFSRRVSHWNDAAPIPVPAPDNMGVQYEKQRL